MTLGSCVVREVDETLPPFSQRFGSVQQGWCLGVGSGFSSVRILGKVTEGRHFKQETKGKVVFKVQSMFGLRNYIPKE